MTKTPQSVYRERVPFLEHFSTNMPYLTWHKNDIRLLTHLLTGWNYLNFFQNKIGNEPSGICSRCTKDMATTEHSITNCSALAYHRQQVLGHLFITSNWFFSLDFLPFILRFAKLTKYFDYFKPPWLTCLHTFNVYKGIFYTPRLTILTSCWQISGKLMFITTRYTHTTRYWHILFE